MTPARLAAEQTWAEDPRLMTPEVAAALAVILPDGDEEAQATSCEPGSSRAGQVTGAIRSHPIRRARRGTA
jgi:hypothetical protein